MTAETSSKDTMYYCLPIPSWSTPVCDTRNFFGNAVGLALFLNEKDSDVCICVNWKGNRWHLPAHKLILSTMSEVFRTMFRTEMSENVSGKITIEDCSPMTVKRFLKYLYMGMLDLNEWKEAAKLLKMAHKYSVYALEVLCESHLISVVSFSNVCYLHELAQTYSLASLKRITSNFILDTAFVVSATEGFNHLSLNSLEYFLKSNMLNMENEACVLSSLREWAIIDCCRRRVSLTRDNVLSAMKPLMKFIKWDLIPSELRPFVPDSMVNEYSGRSASQRRKHRVPSCIKDHVSICKLIVELGALHTEVFQQELSCLKFGVDRHVFIVGFRIVGQFKKSPADALGTAMLCIGRDNAPPQVQCNLLSLSWTQGVVVDRCYVWSESIAFLPHPIRVDPFGVYELKIKYSKAGESKWPSTRVESTGLHSDLGPINFFTYSRSYGLTQLFLLPAPPNRNICSE